MRTLDELAEIAQELDASLSKRGLKVREIESVGHLLSLVNSGTMAAAAAIRNMKKRGEK